MAVSQKQMQFTYTITFEEYSDALKQRTRVFRGNRSKSYYYTSWRGLILLLLCLSIGLLLSQLKGSAAYAFWTCLIAFYGVGLVYRTFICPRVIRKSYEQQMSGFSCEAKIDETGIELQATDGNSHARYRWAAFKKQAESESIFVLFFNSLQFVILPKRAMTTEQSENLHNLAVRLEEKSSE